MPIPILVVDPIGISRVGYGPLDILSPIAAQQVSPYPMAATPIIGFSSNVANALASASLAGTAGKTTFITGFEITSSGATAAAVVSATVANLLGGNLTYIYTAVAGVLLGNPSLIVEFPLPIPASGPNTNIVVSMPALGLGSTNAMVTCHGYQQ